MLSNIQKSIIIKAVKIRIDRGEDVQEILESYNRLTDEEKDEIMSCL